MGGKASIVLVLGFGLILGYISLNLNRYSTGAIGNMTSYYDATSSHHLALAGANAALAIFYQDTSWTGPLTQTLEHGSMLGGFTARVYAAGVNRKVLRSISSYPSSASGTLHDTIDVTFNTATQNSYTQYAWMTNNDGNVFWSEGDTVWGRAHSNGNVHISGSPVFMDKATTAKKFDPPVVGKGTNQAVFKNSYETGIPAVPMPGNLSTLVSASTSGGLRYASDIAITLSPGSAANNDGTAFIKNLSSGIIDTVTLTASGFNGVIVGNGMVSVEGTLDGKLTIASLQSIKVTNDVLYERNPRFGSSDDLLGIVAETDVIIADNTPNHSNSEIQACILARTGSLKAENLKSLPVCGQARTLGSVIQNTEQEVGLYTAKGSGKPTLTNGFSKDFRYDLRLLDSSYYPPYFPGYDVPAYSIANWWESYRISFSD